VDYVRGKFNPAELIDKIILQLKKWEPLKVGVEAYSAQTVIGFYLQDRMKEENVNITYQEILQKGDKTTKIRRLIPLWRDGRIIHHPSMIELEQEALSFPVGIHDDILDAIQMSDEFKFFTLPREKEQQYFEDMGITFRYNEFGEPV
jgi:phage terminase large subunit-like protein